MFGGGSDPFGDFRSIHNQMRAMDNMMNYMMNDAFSMLNGFGRGFPQNPMISNGPNPYHDDMMLSPFGNPFMGMGNIMGHMNSMHDRAMSDPNSIVFSNSTMVSFDGSGPPKVVQQSTRKAGGAQEIRRAVRDGEQEHLSVGHTLGDQSHIIEKKRDKEGRVKQKQRFINLDEDEAERFNDQFKSRAKDFFSPPIHNHVAIEGGYKNRREKTRDTAPIVTIPDDDEPSTSTRRDEDVIYSNNGVGPIIREIGDDETETKNPKRRRGLFGKFID